MWRAITAAAALTCLTGACGGDAGNNEAQDPAPSTSTTVELEPVPYSVTVETMDGSNGRVWALDCLDGQTLIYDDQEPMEYWAFEGGDWETDVTEFEAERRKCTTGSYRG